jgi:hypothetical protein
MSRSKESLIFQCFDHLRSCVEKTKMKLNWARDVLTLLKIHNCTELLDYWTNPHLDFDKLMCRSYILTYISQLTVKSTECCINRMNTSKTMPHFRNIKTHIHVEKIMSCQSIWPLKQLYLQLRSNMPRFTIKSRVVTLNAMETYFDRNSDKPTVCTLCSQNRTENLIHVIFYCTAYTYLRQEFIKDIKPSSAEEAVLVFNNLDTSTLNRIYCFLQGLISVRDAWINVFS